MRNNEKSKAVKRRFTLLMLTAAILCGMIAAPMTAYAKTDEDAETETDLADILTPVVTPEPVPEPEPTPEPQPLTPPGNLTLVDDLSGEQTNDKQFITVITKSGNYFYLVIDRAGDKENVHFLNLVDEADLLAILEGDQKPTPPAPVEPAPETPAPAEPQPEPEPQRNNTGGLLIGLVIIALIGGGAFYYFKIVKPKKQGAAKNKAVVSELDEFDFDPDEDELYTDSEDGADGDEDGEMPDFTITDADDSGTDEDINFDFSAGTPESGDK